MLRNPSPVPALAFQLVRSRGRHAKAVEPTRSHQADTVVAPETPAKTKTTTTQSTSSTAAVPDESGSPVAVQKTTDTTQTTTTEPANPGCGSPSATKSTTTDAPRCHRRDRPATTTTTTTHPASDRPGAAVTAATAADVKAGMPVFDQKGGVVGKIEVVSAKGVVVSTGKVKAEIPVSSFGKNDKGLVMSMTKTELEAASAKSAPAKAAPRQRRSKR